MEQGRTTTPQEIVRSAAALAHDFNNHLMVILGYAEDFCQRFTGNDQDQAFAIRQAASKAADITSRFLDLTSSQE